MDKTPITKEDFEKKFFSLATKRGRLHIHNNLIH